MLCFITMSYEVLARKYRPSSFEEVVGQEHVIQALANSILQDRIHQAFIFSGTRGVGKTTLGRILAKCLNCSSSEKPVAIPCNKCVNCDEIKLGRSLDFYEQDAAIAQQIHVIFQAFFQDVFQELSKIHHLRIDTFYLFQIF